MDACHSQHQPKYTNSEVVALQFWAFTNYPPLKIKFLRVGKTPSA